MNPLLIFAQIAHSLKEPLVVLIAFVVVIMVSTYCAIVKSGVIPVLTKKAGGEIVKRIIAFVGVCAVLVIILSFWQSKNSSTFDFTVFLENRAGENVIKNSGRLFLRIGNDKREEPIDLKGCSNFKQIPASMKGNEASLQMEVAGWQFTNGKNATVVHFKGNSATAVVEPDNSLRFITGRIKDTDDNFLSTVRVSCGDVTTSTDTIGWFSLDIPVEKQKPMQTIIAEKSGYESWEGFAYPASKAEIRIILSKEKSRQ